MRPGRADRPGQPMECLGLASFQNTLGLASGSGLLDGHSPSIDLQIPMALMLSNNRMLAGVCGGLAEWLGWDPTLVRILYAILTVFTAFSGLIVYLLLWIIMPRKSS